MLIGLWARIIAPQRICDREGLWFRPVRGTRNRTWPQRMLGRACEMNQGSRCQT
ncbi:hypothetical protein LI328DRAFT_134362 [Trichoderma asperelloides]|nr:hypothetical protein LI328DRAFT_134362 [Trichoderma asperelloides]